MRDVTLDGLEQIRFAIDAPAMLKAGMRAIKLIRTRTLSGVDKDGNPFRPYSTKTFAVPAGALTKRARLIMVKNGQLRYFNTQSGQLWMVVTGGYLAMKKALYKQTAYDGTVNLTASGQMLRSITVLNSGDNTATIGFSRNEDALKAFWNAEKGREFLGLTEKELHDDELVEIFKKGIKIV